MVHLTVFMNSGHHNITITDQGGNPSNYPTTPLQSPQKEEKETEPRLGTIKGRTSPPILLNLGTRKLWSVDSNMIA